MSQIQSDGQNTQQHIQDPSKIFPIQQAFRHLTSKKYYGNIQKLQKGIPSFQSVKHAHQLYFQFPFEINLLTNQEFSKMMRHLEKQIHQYVVKLIREFLFYAFEVLQYSRRQADYSQISFKQFVCMNLILNLSAMVQTFNNDIFPYYKSQNQLMKTQVIAIIQNSLKSAIVQIKKKYMKEGAKESQKSKLLKENILQIDRRQNEEYDIYLIHNIIYKNPSQLVNQTLIKINQISTKQYSFKINQKQTLPLYQEISTMFNYILEHKNDNESLQQYLSNKSKFQLEHIRKIKDPFPNNVNIIQDFQQYDFGKSAPLLRIITKFIEGLLSLIQNPINSTLKRTYPYKSIVNQIVITQQKLNKSLFQNLQKLYKNLNQGQLGSQLSKIKLQMLNCQKKIFYDPNIKNFLVRQKQISTTFYKQSFKIFVSYLYRLIQLIIDAGRCKIAGKEIWINLITFNIGDLFRARKTVPPKEFKAIMKKIYDTEKPRKNNSDFKHQNIFRIIRIKDKTQTDSQGVLVNILFLRSFPCQIQVKTRIQKTTSSYEICHLLYQLQRGQFGILCEMLNLIASNYKQGNHPTQRLLLFSEKNNNEKPTFNITNEIKQTYDENKSVKELFKALLQSLQQYIKQNKKQTRKVPWMKVFLQDVQEDPIVNNKRRQYFQNIIDQKLLKQDNTQNQLDYIKSLIIKIKIDIPKEDFLKIVSKLIFLQRLIISGASELNINNIQFINTQTFRYLKMLDLSCNSLSNFQEFTKKNIFFNLQILNLSNNCFKGRIIFVQGWFQKLKKLNLSNNLIHTVLNLDKFRLYLLQTKFLSPSQIVLDGTRYKQFTHKSEDIQILEQYIFKVISNIQILKVGVYNLLQGKNLQIIIINDEKYEYDYQKTLSITKSNQTVKDPQIAQKRKVMNAQNKYDQDTFLIKMNLFTLKSNSNTYQAFYIGNSNILVTHLGKLYNRNLFWDWIDPQKHLQIKQSVFKQLQSDELIPLENSKRIKYFQQIQQIWFDSQCFKNSTISRGICVFFPRNTIVDEEKTKKPHLTIVYLQKNEVIDNFRFTGVIHGSISNKKINRVFSNIQINFHEKYLRFIDDINKDLLKGAPIIYLQQKQECSQLFYLGVYNNSRNGTIFDEQFVANYLNWMNTIMNYDLNLHFMSFLQFKIIASRSQSFFNATLINNLKKIEKNKINTQFNNSDLLRLIVKMFKKIKHSLNSYSFFNHSEIEKIKKDGRKLIQNIFLHNIARKNEKKHYQIALFGFSMENIFSFVQRTQKKEIASNLLQIVKVSNQESSKFFEMLLDELMQMKYSQQIDKILIKIKQFINGSSKNKNGDISLAKKLTFIIQVLCDNQTKEQQITKCLDNAQLDDQDYCNPQRIFFQLSLFNRVRYFGRRLRAIKSQLHVKNYNNIKENDKIASQIGLQISRLGENYCYILQRFIYQNSKKEQLVENKLLDEEKNKIILIGTLSRHYQIDLSQNFICQYSQIFSKGLKMIQEKLMRVVKQVFQQSRLNESLFQIFSTKIETQLKLLILQYNLKISKTNLLSNSDKKFLKESSKNQGNYKLLQYKNIKMSDSQIFQKVYENIVPLSSEINGQSLFHHIGAVIVFESAKITETKNDFWRQYIVGSGTLIKSNIVITAAHIIIPALNGQYLPQNKIFFKTPKSTLICVDQVRFLRNHDIAFLILKQSPINNPIVRLVTHQIMQQNSVFEGKRFFCQLIGFYKNEFGKYQLGKIQGLIKFQKTKQIKFNYQFQACKIQQGAPIIFYPTGCLKQPFIYGIHLSGFKMEDFYSKEDYFVERLSTGSKIQTKQMVFLNKIQQIPYLSDTSSIFLESMLFINKWRLTIKLSQKISEQSMHNNIRIVCDRLLKSLANNLVITQIHLDSMICYRNYCNELYAEHIQYYHQKLDENIQKNSLANFDIFAEKSVLIVNAIKIIDKFLKQFQQLKKMYQIEDMKGQAIKIINDIQNQVKQIYLISFMKFKENKFKNMIIKCNNLLTKIINFKSEQTRSNLINLFLFFKNQIDLDAQRCFDQMRLEKEINALKSENKFPTKNEQFNQEELKDLYFNQESVFIKQIEEAYKKNYDKNMKIVIKYQIVKLIAEIIYQYFSFCIKNNVVYNIEKSKYEFEKRIRLIKPPYSFYIKQENKNFAAYFERDTIEKLIKHRFNVINMINDIPNLNNSARKHLFQRIYNYGEIQKLFTNQISNQALQNLQQFISLTSEMIQSSYQMPQNYIKINKDLIILLEISIIQKLVLKYHNKMNNNENISLK